jgi:prepilin peptidase CpaA
MELTSHILVMGSLAAAALTDLARREIPDTCSIAIVGAVLLLVIAQPQHWRDALIAVSAGVALFGAGAVLFANGIWGGGDVKLVGALGAWIGWSGVPGFLLATAVFGGAVSLLVLVLRPAQRFVPWLAAERGVPYGVAIAAAGLLAAPAIGIEG